MTNSLDFFSTTPSKKEAAQSTVKDATGRFLNDIMQGMDSGGQDSASSSESDSDLVSASASDSRYARKHVNNKKKKKKQTDPISRNHHGTRSHTQRNLKQDLEVLTVMQVMQDIQRRSLEYNYDPASREPLLPISFVNALWLMIKNPHQSFALISKACLSTRILEHFMNLLPSLMMMTNAIDLEGTDEANEDNRTTIKYQREFGGILTDVIVEMVKNEKLGKQFITYLKSHLEKVFLLDDGKGGYKDATTRDVVAMGLFWD